MEGKLQAATLSSIKELALNAFTLEIINSYKLENIELNEEALQGIITKRLDIKKPIVKIPQISHSETLKLETIVSVFFEILESKNNPLTVENLINWNKELSAVSEFPTENNEEESKAVLNNYRTEEYNYIKDEKVCYTAPAPKSLPGEMEKFIKWFNSPDSFQNLDNVLKSAITQFYLIALRPFDKNNNILARMLSYRVLYQKEKSLEFSTSYIYSISQQIAQYEKDYKYMLTQMVTGNMDMTLWLVWYIRMSMQAITDQLKSPVNKEILQNHQNQQEKTEKQKKQSKISKHHNKTDDKEVNEIILSEKDSAESTAAQQKQKSIVSKSSSKKSSDEKTDKKTQKPLNKRQLQALEYMKTGVDKKFTTSEYSKLYNCSQDTASRDLEKLLSLDLIEKGSGGGRSTYYFAKL